MTSWRAFFDLLGTLLFIKLFEKRTMQIELSHTAFFMHFAIFFSVLWQKQ